MRERKGGRWRTNVSNWLIEKRQVKVGGVLCCCMAVNHWENVTLVRLCLFFQRALLVFETKWRCDVCIYKLTLCVLWF